MERVVSRAAVFLAPALALWLGACVTPQPEYGFRPTANVAASDPTGFPSSRYVVTPKWPRGEAYVTSFGTREIDAPGPGGGTRQLVHVRLAVSNQSAASMMVVPAEQLLMPPGGASESPEFLEIDGRSSSDVTIPRGQRRVFDMYYPMPGNAADARFMAGFQLRWQVHVDNDVFAEATPFAREPYDQWERSRNAYADVGVAPPWWVWWYGPVWWGPGPFYYAYGPRYYPHHYYGGGYYGPRSGGYHGGYGGGGMGRGAPPMRGHSVGGRR